MDAFKFGIVLFIAILIPEGAWSYPDGAPANVCDTMTPSHGQGVVGQATQSPYNIIARPASYKCGDSVTVTIAGTGAEQIEGFLCQARTNKDAYSSTVGTLAPSGSVTMKQNCGSGRALTHSSNTGKNSVVFTWTTDRNNGNVTFVCTLVKSKATFWVKQTSDPIMYIEGGQCNGVSHVITSVVLMLFPIIAKVFM